MTELRAQPQAIVPPTSVLTAGDEVARGERFAFGKNWQQFLRMIDDTRIRQAEVSLAQMLRDDDAEPLEGEALKREAARLRKRFQLLSEKLKELGRREGLLPPDGGHR